MQVRRNANHNSIGSCAGIARVESSQGKTFSLSGRSWSACAAAPLSSEQIRFKRFASSGRSNRYLICASFWFPRSRVIVLLDSLRKAAQQRAHSKTLSRLTSTIDSSATRTPPMRHRSDRRACRRKKRVRQRRITGPPSGLRHAWQPVALYRQAVHRPAECQPLRFCPHRH